MKEYALYKGDTLLCMGTISFIARTMGVKRESIAYFRYPAYQRRLEKRGACKNVRVLVDLSEDADE